MASAAAPAMEYVFVNASGPNRRPSCPSRVKIGIKDRVMISRLMNNAGPTSTEASVITFQRVALSICSPDADDHSSSRLCAFSIITMAASTIAPTAIAIPPSDMILAFSPLEVHDDKGDTQAKRQRDNRHQGRTYVPQEQSTDDGHHDKLFQKFGAEVINRPVD